MKIKLKKLSTFFSEDVIITDLNTQGFGAETKQTHLCRTCLVPTVWTTANGHEQETNKGDDQCNDTGNLHISMWWFNGLVNMYLKIGIYWFLKKKEKSLAVIFLKIL